MNEIKLSKKDSEEFVYQVKTILGEIKTLCRLLDRKINSLYKAKNKKTI